MKTSRSTSHTATVLYLLKKKIANWGIQSITTGCFELPVINLISLYTLLKYIFDTKKFFRHFTTKFISLDEDFLLNNSINIRKRSVLISPFLPANKSQHKSGGGGWGLSFKNFSGKQNYICSQMSLKNVGIKYSFKKIRLVPVSLKSKPGAHCVPCKLQDLCTWETVAIWHVSLDVLV